MVPKIVSAAVVAVALLIAGCGGSHKSADTATHASTPTGATTPTATAETRPEVPADHAIASGALLTLPDFPTGWEQQDQSGGQELADLSGDRDRPGVAVRPRHQPSVRQGLRRLRGRCRLRVSERVGGPDVVRRAERRHRPTLHRQGAGRPARQGGGVQQRHQGHVRATVRGRAVDLAGRRSVGGRPDHDPLHGAGSEPRRGGRSRVRPRRPRYPDPVIHRLRRCLRSHGRGRSDTDRSQPAGRTAARGRAGARATTTTPTTITSTTPRTTPTSTAPAHTTTTPSTPTQLTTTPARTTTTTTPTTTTTTTPSGSQPSASAVAKAEQLLPICRREQPNITLQELEREAESPLGIQC